MPTLRSETLPANINCPYCGANMDLDDQERSEKRFICPACNKPIDLSVAGSSSRLQAKSSPQKLGATDSNQKSEKAKNEAYRCSKCGAIINYGDPICRNCGEKLEYDEPLMSAPTSEKTIESGRGALILTLGILSLVLLGPILGIPAWVMGNRDLKKIRAGLIASAQKGLTRSGMILGIIGTVVIPFIFIVGIVVAVAITMFSDSAISANRDALTSDLVNLASRAQQYYRRPVALGGGGYTFSGLTADATGLSRLTNKTSNGNGTYSITVGGSGRGTAAFLILTGIGNELNNGTAVQVQAKVWPDRDSVWTVN